MKWIHWVSRIRINKFWRQSRKSSLKTKSISWSCARNKPITNNICSSGRNKFCFTNRHRKFKISLLSATDLFYFVKNFCWRTKWNKLFSKVFNLFEKVPLNVQAFDRITSMPSKKICGIIWIFFAWMMQKKNDKNSRKLSVEIDKIIANLLSRT